MTDGNIANILNRAIVIHEKADDFAGASGNAGSRISCGIIEEYNEEWIIDESPCLPYLYSFKYVMHYKDYIY